MKEKEEESAAVVDPIINLNLALSTVNFILAALGDLAVKTNAGSIIGEIHKQGEAQLFPVEPKKIISLR